MNNHTGIQEFKELIGETGPNSVNVLLFGIILLLNSTALSE